MLPVVASTLAPNSRHFAYLASTSTIQDLFEIIEHMIPSHKDVKGLLSNVFVDDQAEV